jgi:hypothetical protein
MSESFEEYLKRVLGYLGSKDPVAVMRATHEKLTRATAGVSLRRLSASPAKGKWSVRQILAHLADDELVWGYRIRKILETNGVAIEGFDQDLWVERGRYKSSDPAISLEMLRGLRRANLQLLNGLPKSAWSRYGRHSEFGRLTISKIAKLLAAHDLNHLIQVKRILK